MHSAIPFPQRAFFYRAPGSDAGRQATPPWYFNVILPENRPKRVTLKDLAADLGLSPMAISKALRGHSDIGEQTRARVARRASEMGYQANQVARQLVSGRTRLIGMVVPSLATSFFPKIAEGTAQWLRRQGYHLLISSTQGDAGVEVEQVRSFLSHRVDALIIAPSGPMESPSEFEYIQSHGPPFVLVGRGVPAFPVNFAGSDGVGIGRMAAEHLIRQGCRRIAHIAGPAVAGSRQREAGYRAALGRHGLKAEATLIAMGGDSAEGGYDAAARLFRRPLCPDGIVCYNDVVAAGAMTYLLEAGIHIPDEVALTGVGNLTFSGVFRVPLTTIEQSPLDMGIGAAQLVLRLISAPAATPARILIPSLLIERASSQRRAIHTGAKAG